MTRERRRNKCRHCGDPVDLKQTIWVTPPYKRPEFAVLAGAYCSADCVLHAWARLVKRER